MKNTANLRLIQPPTASPAKTSQGLGNPLDPQQRLRLVVDAAARRFEADGFHGTSLQNIADDVGVTKAALYHYLDSKEQLLFMIHDAFVSTMIESAEAFVATETDPEKQVAFYASDIIATIASYRPYVKAFFRDYGVLKGELQTELRRKRLGYEALVEQTLRNGLTSGVFRADLDPRQGALFLFGACNWAYQWLNPEHDDVTAISENWSEMLLRSFRS